MSNLGWYQIITSISKKVGGPKKFCAMLVGGGVIIGGTAVYAGEAIKRYVAQELEKKKQEEAAAIIYTVNHEGTSKEGLIFMVGETYRVLETDGDAGLIEKIGDENSPYFVSLRFLSSVSDYGKSAMHQPS